ncbi:uncharacterized protein N7477_009578 [Penicillium maclennaniae]|uniref:uncharacterized protein n=1 Tax=Penicillium maclennaniae TaxID=1343394 RepID=UPI002540DE49|nr:uncharacterized protein N7477_009578 [Penicillium maclennaniae]KAJ5661962.1 hypothetical protein N7477_009578 [Penicillium maclennaniae]
MNEKELRTFCMKLLAWLNAIVPHRKLDLRNGIWDNVQLYNVPKFGGFHERQQSPVIFEHIAEVEQFSRIVEKLLRAFAILLELPDEDQLVKDHQYDVADEKQTVVELYSPGHSNLGTVTLLFGQAVAALQLLDSEGECVHRVHAPPADQTHVDRLGVLYVAWEYNRGSHSVLC